MGVLYFAIVAINHSIPCHPDEGGILMVYELKDFTA